MSGRAINGPLDKGGLDAGVKVDQRRPRPLEPACQVGGISRLDRFDRNAARAGAPGEDVGHIAVDREADADIRTNGLKGLVHRRAHRQRHGDSPAARQPAQHPAAGDHIIDLGLAEQVGRYRT